MHLDRDTETWLRLYAKDDLDAVASTVLALSGTTTLPPDLVLAARRVKNFAKELEGQR